MVLNFQRAELTTNYQRKTPLLSHLKNLETTPLKMMNGCI